MSEKQAYNKYYLYLCISLIVTILGAIIGENFLIETILGVNPVIELIIVVGSLLLVSFTKGIVKKIMFYIFCFIEGLFLSPLLLFYTSTSLITAIGLTLVVTIIGSFIGYKIKLKSSFGKYLFVALISVLIYSIAGIFIQLPAINLIIMILFSLYIVYDSNMFMESARRYALSNDDIIDFVINMYLNILNIFISILRLTGNDD